MQRIRWQLAGLLIGMVGLSGCALLLLGAGATAGYAVSKDTVKNSFDLSKEAVYRRSLAVVKDMGLVTVQDESHGMIRAKVQDANVLITVRPVTQRTVELKVKARNPLLMPELEVAHAVYNKILEGLD